MYLNAYHPVNGVLALRGVLGYPKMPPDVSAIYRNTLLLETDDGPVIYDILAENEIAEELMQYNVGEHISILAIHRKDILSNLKWNTGLKVVLIDHYNECVFDMHLMIGELYLEMCGFPEMQD